MSQSGSCATQHQVLFEGRFPGPFLSHADAPERFTTDCGQAQGVARTGADAFSVKLIAVGDQRRLINVLAPSPGESKDGVAAAFEAAADSGDARHEGPSAQLFDQGFIERQIHVRPEENGDLG